MAGGRAGVAHLRGPRLLNKTVKLSAIDLLALYRKTLFYSDVVAEYDAIARKQQLVLGYRLHGNLMALADVLTDIVSIIRKRGGELLDYLGLAINLIGVIPFPPVLAPMRLTARPLLARPGHASFARSTAPAARAVSRTAALPST